MSSDRFARIQFIQLRAQRLNVEARRCDDLDRLRAINAELEVLFDSMCNLREEQLLEQIDPPKDSQPRRWWQFWRLA